MVEESRRHRILDALAAIISILGLRRGSVENISCCVAVEEILMAILGYQIH